MTDPQGMAKLDPKGKVGTNQNIAHRNDFSSFCFHYRSMGAIDNHGICQFAPKGLDWQDLSGGALDVATY